MSLPLSIANRLNQTYDGFKAAIFTTSSEYHNFTIALKEAGASFKTKISKHKKRGREFVVMLVGEAQ
jgi:DNA modification methylase